MGEPWGISGPAFLGIYFLACVVALIVSGAARLSIGRFTSVPRGQPPLTVDQVAYLVGGPNRMVDAVVATLIERQAIRPARGGTLYLIDGAQPRNAAEQAVLSALRSHPGCTIERVQGLVIQGTSFDRMRAELTTRGLLIRNGYRRVVLAALPLIVVGVIGLIRLINGVMLNRPTDSLAVLLGFAAIGIIGFLVPLPNKKTRAGDRVVIAARNNEEVARLFRVSGSSSSSSSSSYTSSSSSCGGGGGSSCGG